MQHYQQNTIGRTMRLCALFVTFLFMTQVLADGVGGVSDEGPKGSALTVVDSQPEDNSEGISSVQLNQDAVHSGKVKKFIPTKEWQTLEEGQSVPRGIHVRLNLETGQREAKLLDDREERSSEPKVSKGLPHHGSGKLDHMQDSLLQAMKDLEDEASVHISDDDTEDRKHGTNDDIPGVKQFTRHELKNSLKKFKASKDDVQNPLNDEEKSKFRSMDQIQQEFKDMGIDVKTDLEIISEILPRYNRTDISEDERVSILTDLEYYVHQIDNGVNFADMGGLRIVIKDLNSTSDRVRSEAAFVLASAVQSNPKVQVSAIDHGAMQQLIRMLSVEHSPAVRTRVLTALSSLVRNFPLAQLKLLQLGGMQSLSSLLADPGSASKLSIKAVTLVNDLLVEKALAQQREDGLTFEKHEEKLRQYSRVNLLESVIEHGWCEKVSRLLALPEHDSREKVLNAMVTLRKPCLQHFENAAAALRKLRHSYASLSEEEARTAGAGEELYFQGFVKNIDGLLGDLDGTVMNEL